MTGENYDLSNINGLIKCIILPPQQLLFPVLPVKMHNRLLFPLCRTCAENNIQEDCPHEDPGDRELFGTWTSLELQEAVTENYKIIKIYEIWDYETVQYDPESREGGLFAGYINNLFTKKVEASGFPEGCESEEDKLKFVREVQEAEGVTLDYTKIKKNPALRTINKLALNCLWGKFGMRNNLTRTDIVKSRGELLKLINDEEKQILGILPIDDTQLYVNWCNEEPYVSANPVTNVVIASQTTALARLKLLRCLRKLGDRVAYYDTDSIIFISRGSENEYIPPLGNSLGELTDELQSYGVGSYATEFVAAADKFYGLKIVAPDNSVQ